MFRSFLYLMLAGVWMFPSALAGQDSLLQVVADPGDGIYSLLRKHGADPVGQFEAFTRLNGPKLDGNTHLRAGDTYLIPVSPVATEAPAPETNTSEEKAGHYAIFGETYAQVPMRSNRLEGAVFYLISGHGGPDPGAVTHYGEDRISEDEYAYDITLRLAWNLIADGALVYLIIRDPDDGIRDQRILGMDKDEVAYPEDPIPLGQRQRLQQRVDAVNKLYEKHKGQYQRLIVTHVDSRSQGQNIDVFFYHHEKSRSGRQLAENIHSTFREKYAHFQPNRTYAGTFEDRSNLFVVKNTLPATAFIEIGNIRNTRDQRRILDPDNRQALANWIAEGLLLDFEAR